MKLIDTDVLIEVIRNNRVYEIRENCISIITLLEFLRGIEKESERKLLKENLEKITKIIEINNKVILTYCKLYRELKKKGKILPDADLLQASIAISNNFSLATKKLKHFKRLEKFGLKLSKL